eukprot:6213591-Pleurochrysis_carterae.AAC.2
MNTCKRSTFARPHTMTWPVGAVKSDFFSTTNHPRSTAKFVGKRHGTVGSGGTAKGGAPCAELGGLHRLHPADRIEEPMARVPPPEAATYTGKGPKRVREGGCRGPPRPRHLQPNLKRKGHCSSAHVEVELKDPVSGEGANHAFAVARMHAHVRLLTYIDVQHICTLSSGRVR